MENLCEKFTQATLPQAAEEYKMAMKISCIGSGFVSLAECQLSAYRKVDSCVNMELLRGLIGNAKVLGSGYQIQIGLSRRSEELIADTEIERSLTLRCLHACAEGLSYGSAVSRIISGDSVPKTLAVNLNDVKKFRGCVKMRALKWR